MAAPIASSDSAGLPLEEAAFSRQHKLVDFDDALIREQVCMIIGSGGVGSSTGMTLARLGVKHISFFDMDVVAASNLNRQLLFSPDQVGMQKATACKESVDKIHGVRTSSSAINGDAVFGWKNVVAEAKRAGATAIFNGCDYGGFHDAAIQSLARALGCPYTAASTYAYTYMVDSYGAGAKDACCVCSMPPTHPLCFADFETEPEATDAGEGSGADASPPEPITEAETLRVLRETYHSEHDLLPALVSRCFELSGARDGLLSRSSDAVTRLRGALAVEILKMLAPDRIMGYDSLGFIPKDPSPPTATVGSWVVVCAMGSMFAVNTWVQRLSKQDVPEMSISYINARKGAEWRESMTWENMKFHSAPEDGCPLCGFKEDKPAEPSPEEVAEREAAAEAAAATARWTGLAGAVGAALLAALVAARAGSR